MVSGGYYNAAAGDYSFAAGQRAKARHQGAFVWGDSTDAEISSSASNQFIVRANGGIWFGTTTGHYTPTIAPGIFISTSTGAYLSRGGTWTNASDRNAKESFAPVDAYDVLSRLARVPITTWNYKAEPPSVRHMGPTAQDFYATFELGSSDATISTVDADGVALAAIQALHQHSQVLEAETIALRKQVTTLQQYNADLEAQLAILEARVATLEARPGVSMADAWGWGPIGLLVSGLLIGLLVVGRSRMLRLLPGGWR